MNELTNPFTLKEVQDYIDRCSFAIHPIALRIARQLVASMQREGKLRESLQEIYDTITGSDDKVSGILSFKMMERANEALSCEYRETEEGK